MDTCSFWDLHVAIQDAMGWTDSHLHAFEVKNPKNGNDEMLVCYAEDPNDKMTWNFGVKDYLSCNKKMIYEYDFGDSWRHLIEYEKACEKIPEKRYPICLDGQRACPPEDVGGIGGYEDFLEIMKNEQDPEYQNMVKWVGYKYNPEHFDPSKVRFDNPTKRLKAMLS